MTGRALPIVATGTIALAVVLVSKRLGVARRHNSLNRPYVGMIERSQHFGFVLKASHAFGIAQERRGQDFQRHITLERGVTGFIHLAHPPFAEQGEDFVVPESIAYGKRHVLDSV